MMSKKKEGVAPGSGKAQCRGIPEQGSGSRWMGEQRDGKGHMGLLRSRETGKGKSFEM